MIDKRKFPGVWCCQKREKCTWQGFALHRGLAWGSISRALPPWREAHDKHCGGELIQLIPRSE